MDTNLYLLKRIGAAKFIGLIFGLFGFYLAPVMWPDVSLRLQFGLLTWYATFGAMIGFVGIFDHHPLLKFRMPFWFRGPVFGAWFNLVLALLMFDKLTILFQQLGGILTFCKSPFWVVIEGAIIGLIVDAIATRIAGEGLPDSRQRSFG